MPLHWFINILFHLAILFLFIAVKFGIEKMVNKLYMKVKKGS